MSFVVPNAATFLRILRSGSIAALLLSPLAPMETATAQTEVDGRKLREIELTEVQWTSGFWRDRFDATRDLMIPAMWEIMKGTDYKPFLEHFKIAAGLSEGDHHGAKWNDGDFYKWIESVCAIRSIDDDTSWEPILDEIIEIIGKAQREDGYIHTPVLIETRNGGQDAQPFQNRLDFEMYNMGHLMTTACVHFNTTGKTSLLKIAINAADYIEQAFENPSVEQMRHAICPSHYMGLIDLYRATHETRYLELARRLIEMRDHVEGGGDDNQDRVPFNDQTEAVGHAVRANYLFAGVADLHLESGRPDSWKTLERLWNNVTRKKLYITGASGALYDGASPDGAKDQGSITRVHQAYGRNYQLPNETAQGETCANIGMVLWGWRMALASGDGEYIDVMETALYNSVLSGVSLDGKDYFYTNPLQAVSPPSTELRWSRSRVPFVTSFCCPPNVVRTLARTHGYAYSKSNDAIWVHLYGGSRLATTLDDGSPIRLEQSTDYPWDGNIDITIQERPTRPFSINLRIPGWASHAQIRVNGADTSSTVTPGQYVELERSWKVGDHIQLHLPMPTQAIEAHPLVEETRNQVAVRRGPIVYCIESEDLPQDVAISEVYLPRTASFEPRFDPELLGGVVAIDTEIVLRKKVDWNDSLYRVYDAGKDQVVKTRLVPYYTWANRGTGEMSVWLPLR